MEDDLPKPTNAYRRSTLAAEKAGHIGGVSSTILRPVVINGDGKKGDFKALGQSATWERLGCALLAFAIKFLSKGWNPTQPSTVTQ